jgi:transcriptional regulator with XRE-family HTH domain
MNQPDLGLKVAELRQQKGWTQEKLAEYCEVTTRTIQRIESGEVVPRAFTRNSLSNVLEFDLNEDQTGAENLWLMALHISSCIPIIFPPLLIWSWKKNQSYKIDRQGREVLNFQITMSLLLFLGIAVCVFLPVPILMFVMRDIDTSNSPLVLLPMIPFVTIGPFTAYQGIANAFRALADKPVRYRLSIPFVK